MTAPRPHNDSPPDSAAHGVVSRLFSGTAMRYTVATAVAWVWNYQARRRWVYTEART